MTNQNDFGPIARKDGIKVTIDKDLCIGAATCTIIADKTFKLNDEQKAVIVDINAENLETVIQAAQSCPVDAITVEDKNGKVLWP